MSSLIAAPRTPRLSPPSSRDPDLWETFPTVPPALRPPGTGPCSSRAHACLADRAITWTDAVGAHGIRPGDTTYPDPTGFRVAMRQVHTDPAQWIIVGTSARTTVCHAAVHRPGGGKSEISKSIADAITVGVAYVANLTCRHGRRRGDRHPRLPQRYAEPPGTHATSARSSVANAASAADQTSPSTEFSEHNAPLDPTHVPPTRLYVIKDAHARRGRDWQPLPSSASTAGQAPPAA